ncbi:PAS domain S-box protein [Phormidium sp. CCY1219]|uniref:PAS domain S-box protein n=1 Tax=Phormidium sp. CCY1219 TaxID=2886104 RepID=UPI002D1F5770|nr:PAS domain S-box protein [Phormidium sp. CCY1219]MEB3827721.1 PAS domain S-box protein [Phormidium sp. CCY1219]
MINPNSESRGANCGEIADTFPSQQRLALLEERCRALEATLRQKESELNRYRTLYDGNPCFYVILDSDGVVLQVDRWEAQRLGDPPPGLTGSSMLQWVWPDDRPSLQETLQGATQEGATMMTWEGRLEFPGRAEVRVCATAISVAQTPPPTESAGRRVILIARENGDRPVATAPPWDRDPRYCRIFETAPMGMALIHLETHQFIEVNPTLCNMLGYSQRELTQRTWMDITPEEDIEENMRWVKQVIRGENARKGLDKRYIKKNGEIIWANLNATVMGDAEGKPIYRLGTIQDISDRIASQSALQDSEQLLQNVLQTLPVGVWILDKSARILRGNLAGEKIWGGVKYVTSDRYDQYCAWWPDSGKRIEPDEWPVKRVLTTGKTCRNDIMNIQSFDGKRKTILTTAVPLRDRASEIVGAVVVAQDITEQRLVENALWENQRSIQKIADATPTILYLYDCRAKQTIYCNQQVSELLGYSPKAVQQIESMFPFGLIHPHDRDSLRHNIERLIAAPEGDIVETEYRLRDASDRWRWFVGRDIVFTRTAEGVPQQILGTATDISDRKEVEAELERYRLHLQHLVRIRTSKLIETNQKLQAEIAERIRTEEQLRESEKRYRLLAENSTDLISTHNREGIYRYVSPACTTLLGYDAEELLGHNTYEFLHPEDIDTIQQCHARILERAVTDSAIYRFRHRDGHYAWLESTMRGVWDSQTGEFIEIQCASREIGDRVRSQQALQDSEERFRQLAENLTDVFWMISADRRELLYVSPALERICGRACASLYERPESFLQWIYPPDRHRAIVSFADLPGGNYDEEYRIQRPDGEIRWIRSRAFPVRDASGVIYRIAGISQDITELKQAQAEKIQLIASLQDSQHFIQKVADTAPVIIYLYDILQQRNLYANREIAEVLGYTPEQIQAMGGDAMPMLLHPEDLERRSQHLEQFERASNGEMFQCEIRIRDARGEWRYLQCQETVFARTAQGQPQQILGAAIDITDRVLAEAAIRESREKYRVLFQVLPVGISVSDNRGNLIEVNKASERILGISKRQHNGRQQDSRDWQILRRDGSPMPTAEFAGVRALREGRLVENQEAGVVKPNGDITWIRVTAAPIPLDGYGVAIAYMDITELTQTMEELRRSERKFRTLAENIPDIVARFDRNLRYLYVNPAIATVTNSSIADCIGKTHQELGISAEVASAWNTMMQTVFETGRDAAMDLAFPTAKGIRYYHVYLVPEFGDNSEAHSRRLSVESILCISRDITVRKQMEDSLKMARARLQHLIAVSPAAIYSCKPYGDFLRQSFAYRAITFISHNVSAMVGYDPQEFLDAPHFWSDRVHPEDLPQVLARGAQLSHAKSLVCEYRFRTGNGDYRWIYDAVQLVCDEAGDPLELVGSWIDISDRKAAEEQLLRLSQTVEAARDAIAIADPHQTPLYHNPAFVKLFGYTVADCIALGGPCALYADPTLGTEVFEAISRGDAWTGEVQMLTREGETLDILLRAYAISNDRGECIGLVGIHTDISDRKRMEQELAHHAAELARSNRELEQFAYIASHDLQEPLRMVASYTELLSRRYRGQLDEKADKFIAYAIDGANRMQQLIDDLLQYSRVGTRGKPFVPVDMQEIFTTVTRNLQMAIEERAAVVTCADLPVVNGDNTQLLQLLQNLIGNGIKYCEARSPRVHLDVTYGDNEWLFSVRDNGIGLDPKFSDRIFLIFQRLHTREEYSGTGIGLAICKRIVERHGGRIWVESQPEIGSTFYFTLPDSLTGNSGA